MTAASAGERTIVYVGTTGGLVNSPPAEQVQTRSALAESYLQGGVYQQTIVHRPGVAEIYLPLVLRSD